MGIWEWFRLRSFENSRIRGEIAKISEFPADSHIERLGVYLHHLCVENAAKFVQEEQRRGKDSIFDGLDHRHFFHEMLLLNYWLANKALGGKDRKLLGEMEKQYLVSFHHLSEQEKADDLSHMEERFSAFSDTWDDVTGHQDLFAEKFCEYLMKIDRPYPVKSVCFWVITHADNVMKKFRDLKKICKELGVMTRKTEKKAPAQSS